ncbi:MAG: hypothetical protein JNL67_05170 [Planctomycetaceae bacterium]|nr:hypothetical protein [Planctomycetaceae bacterium]
MARPMTETFWRRRLRHLTLFLLLLAVVALWSYSQDQHLGRTSFPTGYALFAIVLVLAGYRVRKRWHFLRGLGTSSAWLHFHIYLGMAAFVMFWLHVGFRWPMGTLEQILATVFLLITGSGFYGLYLTRTYPKKLTAVGNEVLFEQIPVHRRQLVRRAEALALDSKYQSEIFIDFIDRRLLPFLTRGRSLYYMMFPNGGTRRALLTEVENLKRYLTSDHQNGTVPLKRLIQDKDDLDFHYALQGRLKGWLFVHVCLTGILLALAGLHTVLVHVFQGGF